MYERETRTIYKHIKIFFSPLDNGTDLSIKICNLNVYLK